MSRNPLSLNLLNFVFTQKQLTFGFTDVETPDVVQLSKPEIEFLKSLLKIPENTEKYFTSFDLFAGTGGSDLTLDIKRSEGIIAWPKSLLRKFVIFKLKQYFIDSGLITRLNFTNDLEVWLPGKSLHRQCNAYQGITLRIQFERITDKPEILVIYNGLHHVMKQALNCELFNEMPSEHFSWLLSENTLFRHDCIPDKFKRNQDITFPCLNKKLQNFLNLPALPPDRQNRYKLFDNEINAFADKYLKSEQLKEFMLIDENWVQKNGISFYKENESLSFLKFGNDKQENNSFNGLKKFGPLRYSPTSTVIFFFIVHQDDTPLSYVVHDYLKGIKYDFNGINKLTGINYSTQANFSIIFKDKENPLPEVIQALNERRFDVGIDYVAIYLSPFSKWTQDVNQKRIYYRIKEELLHRGIVSQTLEVNKNWPERKLDSNYKAIVKEGFQFFMPNIAVSLLAKLGGIPWSFCGKTENELVIGISAFKSEIVGQKYLGSAFCFSGEGRFYGFDCFQHNQIEELAGSVLLAVKSFVKKQRDLKRLVLHFYKTMSQKELKPIERGLASIGLQIPVVVVSINKSFSDDIIGFDKTKGELMPDAFTYLPVGNNHYLLYNNGLHPSLKFSKLQGYPLPLKISIAYHLPGKEQKFVLDSVDIEPLLVQICKFSQLYWKSVSAQPLPVTLRYPEMLAQIVPHFSHQELPQAGKETLWFL
jgi:hypothetical protein